MIKDIKSKLKELQEYWEKQTASTRAFTKIASAVAGFMIGLGLLISTPWFFGFLVLCGGISWLLKVAYKKVKEYEEGREARKEYRKEVKEARKIYIKLKAIYEIENANISNSWDQSDHRRKFNRDTASLRQLISEEEIEY